MDEFSQKWAIISLLDDIAEGAEFYYTDNPLHVTFAGVFAIPLGGGAMVSELEARLKNIKKFKVEAEDQANFGPNNDVTVMKIKYSQELMDLYRTIYDWLIGRDAVFNNPQYEGEGFAPHSTFQKSGFLRPGDEVEINSLSIIDLFPRGDGLRRKILKTINLK